MAHGQVKPIRITDRFRDRFMPKGGHPWNFCREEEFSSGGCSSAEHSLELLAAILEKEGPPGDKAFAEESRP